MPPDQRSSEPTPSPLPPPPRSPTGSHAAVLTLEAVSDRVTRRREEIDALRARVDGHGPRLEALEGLIGDHADPILRRPATGIVGVLGELSQAIGELRAELAADRRARDEAVAELAKRREPLSRAAWIGVGTLIACVVGGGYAALIAWVVRHWR